MSERAAGAFPFRYEWHYPVHELKTIDPYFYAIVSGRKTFEVRVNDRGFKPGDLLVLRHYVTDHGYTGRFVVRVAAYVMPGGQFGIDNGHVVMSLHQPSPDLAITHVGSAVSRG